ncbi:SOS response-associated peptidase family protein [Dyella sp. 2HG41-7]|uniref:SOS response-associated peptidase family protein n=1 Tax=Dyella sp. 2HG41-7 TaxID=2883239 RepID=UPI001F32DB3A|nr:SOS response-associated peptidase family protein [Dyella sp. 2HG41-7]
MCYSAEVYSDFRKYQRYGGTLDLKAFVDLFFHQGKKGTFTKLVPKAVRDAFDQAVGQDEQDVKAAVVQAYRDVILHYEEIVVEQTERLIKAQQKLAKMPTKTAENEARIAQKKIDEANARMAQAHEAAAQHDGFTRIWPGHYCPILIRDPATGERRIVPARYRCRLVGWTEKDERLKPGTYNARMDSLKTAWRGIFGHFHAVVVARRFYESVLLHDNQQRALAPGEKEQNIEIVFSPEPEQEMLLACLYRYVEPEGDEGGYFTFAAVTREPPPEVLAAGHNRCVIPLKPKNLDAWLDPDPKNLGAQYAILEDPIGAFYQHQIVQKGFDAEGEEPPPGSS